MTNLENDFVACSVNKKKGTKKEPHIYVGKKTHESKGDEGTHTMFSFLKIQEALFYLKKRNVGNCLLLLLLPVLKVVAITSTHT